MDVLGKIVGGSGCAADGTVAAQNPLARALDSVAQSHARAGPGVAQGRPRAGPSELARQMRREQLAGADAQFLQGFEQEAMARARMEAAFRAGEAPPPAQQQMRLQQAQQASMEAAFEESQRAHFQHFQQQQQQQQQMRMRQADAWASDFRGGHLDDAWQTAGKSRPEVAWDEAKAPALQPAAAFQSPAAAPQLEQAGAEATQTATQTATQQASAEMARAMRANPDAKWQRSEFLGFMQQVSTGEVQIDETENAVTGAAAPLRAEGVLEGAWGDGDAAEGRSNRDLGLEAGWTQSANASAAAMESAFAETKAAPASALEGAWGDAGQTRASGLDGAWAEARTEQEKALDGAWADGDGDELGEIWEKAMAEAAATDPFEDAWRGAEAENDEYAFQSENPFAGTSETFELGVQLFEAGQLDEAILAFEAEVQQRAENSEAWRLLGECHAEHDEDKRAIVCLARAVEEDPYNTSALLALGVSHVNELDPQGALKTLKAWVQHNPKFHGLEIAVDEYSDGSLMDEVMQLMLQARAHDPSDSDVQVVLGVLYNVSKDFDAAAESFRAATTERPDEYALWNKLGATLANSARSAEAIPAYHRALELKPRYARGWLNLGISHANLGNYDEATKCYLQALTLNARAEHIWSYLRICFTCMERFDLVKLADARDLAPFRREFGTIDL